MSRQRKLKAVEAPAHELPGETAPKRERKPRKPKPSENDQLRAIALRKRETVAKLRADLERAREQVSLLEAQLTDEEPRLQRLIDVIGAPLDLPEPEPAGDLPRTLDDVPDEPAPAEVAP